MAKKGVGDRFVPTDIELVGYFLSRKIQNLSIPETSVLECDLYGTENPWEIWERFQNHITFNPTDGSRDLYFFTTIQKMGPNTSRIKRRVGNGNGTWEAESRKTEIMLPDGSCLGYKRRLRFEKSGTNHDGKWIMHEFSPNPSLPLPSHFSQGNEWVLCRIRENEHPSTKSEKKLKQPEPRKQEIMQSEFSSMSSEGQKINDNELINSLSAVAEFLMSEQPAAEESNDEIQRQSYYNEYEKVLLNSSAKKLKRPRKQEGPPNLKKSKEMKALDLSWSQVGREMTENEQEIMHSEFSSLSLEGQKINDNKLFNSLSELEEFLMSDQPAAEG